MCNWSEWWLFLGQRVKNLGLSFDLLLLEFLCTLLGKGSGLHKLALLGGRKHQRIRPWFLQIYSSVCSCCIKMHFFQLKDTYIDCGRGYLKNRGQVMPTIVHLRPQLNEFTLFMSWRRSDNKDVNDWALSTCNTFMNLNSTLLKNVN